MLKRRDFGLSMAAGSVALMGNGKPAKTGGEANAFKLATSNVPGEVPVAVYTPPGYSSSGPRLPLVVLLHGGNGSSKDLLRFTDTIEREMQAGRLDPMVIAMPSARRSLYMDYIDGSQRWERMIVDDLIPHLRRAFNVASGPEGTCIAGISMGGLGALRIAFKHPRNFAAVAALEPAIEAAMAWKDVGATVLFWRPETVLHPMFGNPIEPAYWAENNPATIADRAPGNLLGLSIYFEVGDQDMLHLYDGAEFLHRVLFDARIAHEYRLVHGAEHVGPSLQPRLVDALSFLQRQLNAPNWITDEVSALRETMDNQKRAISFPVEPANPTRMKSTNPEG